MFPILTRRSAPPQLLAAQLPYLTYMAPFTYGISAEGGLLPLDDGAMISAAIERGTRPVMHLSTLTESGQFDTERGAAVLTDYALQDRLISEIFETIQSKGYVGLDVDFEYLPGYLAAAYAAFLDRLHRMLRGQGLFLWAAPPSRGCCTRPTITPASAPLWMPCC